MLENKAEYTLYDNLVCPFCHNQLIKDDVNYRCSECDNIYPITDGIPNFNQKDEYWCNVDREKMHILNQKAKDGGDWLAAAKDIIPEYLDHIEPFDRADAQYLWPITNDSRILDAGSMWGGVTLPVAQHCGEIYALDKTIETLSFLKTRAQQMGFENVHVVASPLQNLPFPDDFFDLVILNGVLEWVAFDQPVILEKHWGKKRTDTKSYSKNPRQMQIDVLLELNRIIKPGGHIFVAIENRIGYQYLAGLPDNHVNLKYVSFLPRFIANIIAKRKLNCEYRTYTYSLSDYRSLLKESRYNDIKFYGAFPHYGTPSYILPIDMVKNWAKKVLPIDSPLAPTHAKIFAKLFPKILLKYVSPSFMILGKKSKSHKLVEPRIVQLLNKVGILETLDNPDINIVKTDSRSGNYYTVNYIVYKKNKPVYFCKICRNESYAEILKYEADNLTAINKLLSDTDISTAVPTLLYSGKVDGISLTVMDFISGERSKFKRHNQISKKSLYEFDKSIKLGINFLVKFQKYTKIKDVDAAVFLSEIIGRQKDELQNTGKMTADISLRIDKLHADVQNLDGLSIPICSVHGDYSYYYNILTNDTGVNVVDFEHFEIEGLPFFDLATLIFNPILMNDEFLNSNLDISSFISRYGLNEYLIDWMNLYANLSGISINIVKLFAKIAALEQQTKDYPYYRNPWTFPMYDEGIFFDLLSLDVDL